MWLVTFSDLVTLLLTFFVLLLSMASMDQVLLSRINPYSSSFSIMGSMSPGRIPQRILMVMELLESPRDVMQKPERLKDLLWPEDMLPPEVDTATLDENLRIMQDPQGLAIVLTDGVLFRPGSWELTAPARKLLAPLADVLEYSSADVTISGHTDDSPASGVDNYDLSGRRAMAVLDFFLESGLGAERFSVSGYGPDKPLESNATPQGRAQNRRVEILLKTTQWLGRYS
jgi:chemotaxis protein MotB